VFNQVSCQSGPTAGRNHPVSSEERCPTIDSSATTDAKDPTNGDTRQPLWKNGTVIVEI
jgi:hypothetical protein